MSVYRVGTNKSSTNVFPSIRPTLDLDFANSKTLDPRITFTRSSGGSYVGADGFIKYAGVNEARFDHDPATGESLGLLIEESRTNLLKYSEEADNPAWNILGSSILVDPNVTIAPNGAQTADKVKEAATTGSHSIEFTGFPFQSGTTYTVSFYAKAVERSRFMVTWPIVFTNRLAFVDLSPSGYGVISDGGTVTSVLPVGDDWFRVVSTSTCTTTVAGARVGITLVDTGTNVNYTGDGISGIYIWGAQLEQGSFPTSYIPTQASTRTRASDNAQITGKNFSDFYRQDEGTANVNWRTNSLNHSVYDNIRSSVISFNGGIALRGYYLDYLKRDEITTFGSRNLSSTQVAEIGSQIKGESLSSTFSYSTTTGIISGLSSKNTSVVDIPLTEFNNNTLIIGNYVISGTNSQSQYLNGTISRLTYFPKRLPNEQLISLTR